MHSFPRFLYNISDKGEEFIFPTYKIRWGPIERSVCWHTITLLKPFKDETNLYYIRNQCVPRSDHSTSVIKTDLLMI